MPLEGKDGLAFRLALTSVTPSQLTPSIFFREPGISMEPGQSEPWVIFCFPGRPRRAWVCAGEGPGGAAQRPWKASPRSPSLSPRHSGGLDLMPVFAHLLPTSNPHFGSPSWVHLSLKNSFLTPTTFTPKDFTGDDKDFI